MARHNREIVSYEITEHPLPKMIESMLAKALDRLNQHERPLLPADQGWQYRLPAFQQRLQRCGLVQSMSRKGNYLDNAAIESFFGTLKRELFYLSKFKSVQELEEESGHRQARQSCADKQTCSLQRSLPCLSLVRARMRRPQFARND